MRACPEAPGSDYAKTARDHADARYACRAERVVLREPRLEAHPKPSGRAATRIGAGLALCAERR